MTDTAKEAASPPRSSPVRWAAFGKGLRLRPRLRRRRSSFRPRPRLRIRDRLRPRSPLPAWWPLALCVLLGTAGGAAHGLLSTPQYAATSYVVVVPAGEGDGASALGYAQAYGRIATGGAVISRAHLRTDLPSATLRGGVESVTSPDAPMIEITGTDARAGRAAEMANAVANSLSEIANASAETTGARLTVFSDALPPESPASPVPAISIAVGACTGGLVGALLVLVRPRRRPHPGGSGVPAPAAGDAAPTGLTEPEKEKEKEKA